MNKLGLHLRINSSFLELPRTALELKLNIFQCFFTKQNSGKYFNCDNDIVKIFLELRNNFKELYAHASYLINFSGAQEYHPLLTKELNYANRLQFTHYVIHAGSYAQNETKVKAIDRLVILLNNINKHYSDLTILIENSANGPRSIGSDLEDIFLIINKINKPEKIKFCIDTAHAYTFGYDLVNIESRKSFLQVLKSFIDKNLISLIHLNDTNKALGSKIDDHCILGEGQIGLRSLQSFIQEPIFKNIPIILELPKVDLGLQIKALNTVKNWI